MKLSSLFFVLPFFLTLVSSQPGFANDDEIELVDFAFDLHELYRNNDVKLFRIAVLDYQYDIHALSDFGFSVLHLAAMQGKNWWIELLLSLGANIELRDSFYDGTPLAWALFAGQSHSFHLLKKHLPRLPSLGTHDVMTRINLDKRESLISTCTGLE